MHANERTAGYENRTLHRTHPLLRRPTLTRPMRIGFLVHKPLPDREADSEQIVNTAAALVNRGHDVSLLMPGRRDAARVTAGEIARYYGTNSSLQVRTVPARFRRELPMSLGHAWSALDRELRERCDVVVTRRFESVVLGLNRGFRMAYDHYRPWPRTVPILRPLFRWIINHPRFAGAFLHSPYARDSYIDLKVPESRVTLAYNGWLPERLLPRLTKEEARLSLGLPREGPVVTYTGRINGSKGLDVVLDMARRMPSVLFLLVGSEGEGEIERAASAIPNIRVCPWQTSRDLPPYLYAADALLIPPSSEPLLKHGSSVLPMKTFVYLAAGRPIFAPTAQDTSPLLIDGRTAALVAPDDADAAVSRLGELLRDDSLQQMLAEGGAKRASVLTWHARAGILEKRFECVVKRGLESSDEGPLEGGRFYPLTSASAGSLSWRVSRNSRREVSGAEGSGVNRELLAQAFGDGLLAPVEDGVPGVVLADVDTAGSAHGG